MQRHILTGSLLGPLRINPGEGVNVVVDGEGAFSGLTYVRRYPFMLARLSPDCSELSLCFDPTSDLIGAFSDGAPLFEGNGPTKSCKATLTFCEQFEIAGPRTTAFMSELTKHKLLMEGEVAIRQDGSDRPFVYRGFQMVDENRLRAVGGDVLHDWNQNGLLPLIFAHLFSLELMRDIFSCQVQLGKGPVPALLPTQPFMLLGLLRSRIQS